MSFIEKMGDGTATQAVLESLTEYGENYRYNFSNFALNIKYGA